MWGAIISAAGGIASGLLGGGNDKQTQTTSNAPWAGVSDYLQRNLSNAQYMENRPKYYFPYQTYAERSPLTQASQQALLGYATNIAPSLSMSGISGLGSLLNSVDVARNPYVNNMIAAQGQGITDQLTRQWLPAIRSGASLAGSYGGSRQGLAEGLAMGEASKAFANAAAQTQLGAYGQGLDAQARALQLMPSISQLGMLPAMTLGQVGGAEEAYRQQVIDDSMARWNYATEEPYQRIGWAGGLYSGISPYGTQTQTLTGGGSSPWATGIGTAMSLYGLGQGTNGKPGLWDRVGSWFSSVPKTTPTGFGGAGQLEG